MTSTETCAKVQVLRKGMFLVRYTACFIKVTQLALASGYFLPHNIQHAVYSVMHTFLIPSDSLCAIFRR